MTERDTATPNYFRNASDTLRQIATYLDKGDSAYREEMALATLAQVRETLNLCERRLNRSLTKRHERLRGNV